MLGTLCTLLTALTCVSGVTVVTQKPVVTVRKGETASMDCNLGTVTGRVASWYKQSPGGVPQFVLYFHHSHSSPTYGSGFSSPKFTSTHQSTTDYRLIISNVEEGYSAVYYCSTWDDSAEEHSIGVSGVTVVTQKPVVTGRKGETASIDCNLGTVTSSAACCTIFLKNDLCSDQTHFAQVADIRWFGDGSEVSSGISTSTAVQQPDKAFQISSYLAVQTSDWNMDKVSTCKVSLGSQTSEQNIKKSDCPTDQ
ncbi:immunoglobulin kappa light chain-like [Eleginops maclovinus]|uniref:immunoglobulin kappa light chain-like n=1 Tax=Eleginops maclovinus TaxID=56733 RepID=UPI003080EC1E